MLSCGHDRNAFGIPLCVHMRTCRKPWLDFVKWYTGQGLTFEFICEACAEAREKGDSVQAEPVCEECYDYAMDEVCDLHRAGGQAEIKICDMPFDGGLREFAIPKEFGKIVDIAPIHEGNHPIWLMLAEDGNLYRVNTRRQWVKVGSATPPSESDHKQFAGHTLTRHLHVSRGSEFAAVVNDYGHYGQVIDLRSGNVTLKLDGGTYYPHTVPFSFAFAEVRGRTVAIHRTAWNRLDISDPSNGKLLTERVSPTFRSGEAPPEHFLNYFHGALYPSPENTRILDDGWVWGPWGLVTIWELGRWLSENPWESEDGPTKKMVCSRDYYWNHGMTWLDDEKVAVGGIGSMDFEMIDGARIFDVTQPGKGEARWISGPAGVRELIAFPGPAGKFFSDGKRLYSSDKTGLSQWDLQTGARTGHLDAFQPTHYHSGTGQLVQLTDRALVQWSTAE